MVRVVKERRSHYSLCVVFYKSKILDRIHDKVVTFVTLSLRDDEQTYIRLLLTLFDTLDCVPRRIQ